MVETILKTSLTGVSIVSGIILLLILGGKLRLNPANEFINAQSGLIVFLGCFVVIGVFVTGVYGISIYRWILYSVPAGIFEFPSPNECPVANISYIRFSIENIV